MAFRILDVPDMSNVSFEYDNEGNLIGAYENPDFYPKPGDELFIGPLLPEDQSESFLERAGAVVKSGYSKLSGAISAVVRATPVGQAAIYATTGTSDVQQTSNAISTKVTSAVQATGEFFQSTAFKIVLALAITAAILIFGHTFLTAKAKRLANG